MLPRQNRCTRLVPALSALLVLLSPLAAARADFIQLGAAGNYAVLGIGGTVSIGSDFEVYQSDTVVSGNVGIGPYTDVTHNFDGTITGRLDYDPTVTYKGGPAGVIPPSAVTGTIGGGLHQMPMTSPVNSAIAADTYFAALAPQLTLSTLTEGQTIMGGHGLNVIRITGAVTLKTFLNIDGFSDSQFVFQLTNTGKDVLTLSGMTMHLLNGVLADNLLWNLSGGGGEISITSMAPEQTVYGTFLAPYRSITVDHGIIDGRVIAGGSPNPIGLGDNFISIHSSSEISVPDENGPPPPVPLPTAAVAGLALCSMVGVRKPLAQMRQSLRSRFHV